MSDDQFDKSKRPVTKKDLLSAAVVIGWGLAFVYFRHIGKKTVYIPIIVLFAATVVISLLTNPAENRDRIDDALSYKKGNMWGKVYTVVGIIKYVVVIMFLLYMLLDWINKL